MCLDHVNYRLNAMSENYGSTKVQSLKHVRVGAGSGRHGRRCWHGVQSAEGKHSEAWCQNRGPPLREMEAMLWKMAKCSPQLTEQTLFLEFAST